MQPAASKKELMKRLRELDLEKALLETQKLELEAKDQFQLKRRKKNSDIIPSFKQVKINDIFSKKESVSRVSLLNNAPSESSIAISQDVNVDNQVPPSIHEGDVPKKIKVSYSPRLRKEAEEMLKDRGLAYTFNHYNRRIPKTTLFGWYKALRNSRPPKKPRKRPFKLLKEELFIWF